MKTFELIVPCFNEQESIPFFYETVKSLLLNLDGFNSSFIFVDDGSRDGTLDEIKKLAASDEKVKYISFSRNFGKESAMLAGLTFSKADYVGIIDADLQHDPALIPEMLSSLESGEYDIAAARRVDRTGEAKFKSVFSKAFYKLINRMSDVKIADGAQDFRVMTRQVVESIVSMREYNRFSKGIFSWVGFKTKWFEHENSKRVAGKSKWSFWSLTTYAIDGIINFSTVPLKISFLIGAFFSFAGLVYALYIILRTIINGSDVPGYPSLFCAILIIGGLILLSLGIIGEYLARIYTEVKDRPSFIVDETNIVKK
ncbi:MAG: glycosyltransferase family 2 protein [Ruminococcaceae bacterium]|nr:glycosyltransferase family 2 protein [Oscillospiraceae bacterium]